MDKKSEIRLLEFAQFTRPRIVEQTSKNWVLNGVNNSFYQTIIDRHNGSPTNSAINNSYIDLIYGQGIGATNANKNVDDWARFKTILSEDDLKKIVTDFQIFNEASFQVIKTKGNGLSSIKHIPKQYVVPNKENEDEEIEFYWVSRDWENTSKNKPVSYPAFNTSAEAIEIYYVKPYKVGQIYFSQPDYISGLAYAEMEERIADNNTSYIRQGLSAGYIINIPDGNLLTDEEKQEFEYAIKRKLTSNVNAGQFVMSFNGRDADITVTAMPVNDKIHRQWDFLVGEARQQLLTAHRVTSPSLVGMSSASGFSSVAEEMLVAEELLMKKVIQPKQNQITNALETVLVEYGINLELVFVPIELETIKPTQLSLQPKVEKKNGVDTLISLGEEYSKDDWEIVDLRRCDEITLRESDLLQLASVPVTPKKNSDQDTSIFKIRYQYAGKATGERDFCNKVINADKLYRAEDLDGNFNYNEDFAPSGSSAYNIFLYKGGVNCLHWWQRVILMKKDNGRISVNQARKKILELEPEDRSDAMWEQNPKEVAQIAGLWNNYWSLDPNYWKSRIT